MSWSRFVREPILWFALLGTGVFLVMRTVAPSARDTIVIAADVQLAVTQQEELLRGRPLSSAEREEAVAALVADEVLLREAYRRGYERSDPRVRQRLLSVMRYTLDEPLAPVSPAEVEAYFQENADRFDPGDALTFDQITFRPGDEDAPVDPAAFLRELDAGADFTRLGSRGFSDPAPSIERATRSQVGLSFGPRIFDLLADQPIGTWTGPHDTRFGRHFFRLRDREPLPPPTLDEVEEYVRQEVEYRRRRELQDARIAEMARAYRVIVEEVSTP